MDQKPLNLTEERERLIFNIQESQVQMDDLKINISVLKSKLKKVEKLINQANEVLK